MWGKICGGVNFSEEGGGVVIFDLYITSYLF